MRCDIPFEKPFLAFGYQQAECSKYWDSPGVLQLQQESADVLTVLTKKWVFAESNCIWLDKNNRVF